MSALATEWAPGIITPGARPFENMPADLAMVGVEYAPEQLDLLNKGSVFRPGWYQKLYAMALMPLPDPTISQADPFGYVCLTVDEQGSGIPVYVPGIVEIDCSGWERFDQEEPNWRRFPSLLGRVHVYSAVTGTILEAEQPFRLWNLWPLEEEDVFHVQRATDRWWRNEWDVYLKWLEAGDVGTTLACDYEGTPAHMHDHEVDEGGYLAACRDGDHWFEQYKLQEMVMGPDGESYHRPFAEIDLLGHLATAWSDLKATSRVNTHAALFAYPEWEREEVRRTERHYSPWLSSC